MQNLNELDCALMLERLKPYVQYTKDSWSSIISYTESLTTNALIRLDTKDTNAPKGTYLRFNRCHKTGLVKSTQVCIVLPIAYIKFKTSTGGFIQFTSDYIQGNGVIDGVRILFKRGLAGTFNQAPFLCFVPDDVYEDSNNISRYIFISESEFREMAECIVPDRLVEVSKKILNINANSDNDNDFRIILE